MRRGRGKAGPGAVVVPMHAKEVSRLGAIRSDRLQRAPGCFGYMGWVCELCEGGKLHPRLPEPSRCAIANDAVDNRRYNLIAHLCDRVSPGAGPSLANRGRIVGNLINIELRKRQEGQLSGVLEGVRVLDFGRYIAGPFCAALLADLGAEVIRIERLGGGEDRSFIPVGAGPEGGGAMFLAMNRNKLGMTLDPATPKGREIVRKLVATADVVVANLPPQVLRGLALDLESLRQVKPDIILTTVTGFGAGGPLSHKHGFDGIGQAMSGAAYLSGAPEQPIAIKLPWVDFGTACLSAFGTLAAL